MNSYIAVVFDTDQKAHKGLEKLWHLDAVAELTVHGAAMLRRNEMGHIRVAHRSTDLGMRTAAGVGVGALLGLLAGPIGAVVGLLETSTLSILAATGVGALAGGAVGATANAVTETRRENAASEAFFTLKQGQSALVAEISGPYLIVWDDALKALGGTVYRRENNAENNAAFGENYYNGYLYPYYSAPVYD